MKRALRLAKRGQGYVEPNPMVGAVLVRDNQIVSEGYHRRCGGAHAEIEALRGVVGPGGRAEDLYVTLEPCCHHGKTPPCTDAIIGAQVRRVFVAMEDPFEQVAGKGIAALREAGIEVHVELCESEARQLNEPYIKRVTTGLPWVIVKWAQTLDGKIATHTGDGQWISNERSRRVVHQLRARVDAIMVGVNTVIADDPQLTARGVRIRREAKRVVIDPNGRLPRGAKVLGDGPATIITSPPLRDVLRSLDATNVLVEGGATLIGSLFAEGLVDQVIAFVAPKVLGGGLSAVGELTIDRIAGAQQLGLRRIKRIGDDVMLDYRVT